MLYSLLLIFQGGKNTTEIMYLWELWKRRIYFYMYFKPHQE
jgi:hypothetical protein